MNNKKKKVKWGNVVVHIVLIAGAILMILPFIWMILTSLKTVGETTRIPIQIFPDKPIFDNYKQVLNLLPFGRLYFNTIVLMLIRVACALVFCSMAGYAFARLNFPLKNLLFGLVLMQMMIPSQVFIIPQYMMVAKLHKLNSMFALVFPGIVSSFGGFLRRQTYMGLPKELEEASLLDGCNRWKAFTRIMLPLSKSSLCSLGVFTALFAWKDLMWPLIVNADMEMMTLSAGLASLQGQYDTNYPVLMAGAVISTIPIIIVYAFLQKYFVQGIALTGSKG